MEGISPQRSQGGLALPNFRYYYWAANISKVLYWLQIPKDVWCISEANSCISSSLPALALSKLPLCISLYTQCPVVTNTLKIWFQFRQCFGFKDFSITSPICKNHLFLPGQLDSVFSQWQQLGLVKFSDLFINYVFAPFSTLSSKYKRPRSHLFRYFQVRHLIQNHCPTYPSTPPSTGLDAVLNIPLHLIPNVYNTLMSIQNIYLDKMHAE